MIAVRSAIDWLGPIRSAVPELEPPDWERLERLDSLLAERMPTDPLRTGVGDRASWLLLLRAELAGQGYVTMTLPTTAGGQGRPAVLQTVAQFICGFHDPDLRDATGPGHGELVLGLPDTARRREWLERLAAGELVGIAATERHGGSRLLEISARAGQERHGVWSLYGEKVWMSRLTESSAFVVFFRDPGGSVSAALVDAGHPGLEREPDQPSGLMGWSWGTLCLRDIDVDPRSALVGGSGEGASVFHRHFTRFRPLVVATALGTAAGVHAAVARTVDGRYRVGVLPRIRDNVRIAVARAYAEVVAHLLQAVATTRLAAADHPDASLWARVGKAAGVDAARRAVDDLLPLVGASGFRQRSRLFKAHSDLTAFTYADGIHDSLYRSGGQDLLRRDRRSEAGRPTPMPGNSDDRHPSDVSRAGGVTSQAAAPIRPLSRDVR